MEPNFNSVAELKQRLMPALRLRRRDLKRLGIVTTEEELWNYFSYHFWKQATNLSLSNMVDDILNKEIDDIKKHDELI